jgi:hypothetical protein
MKKATLKAKNLKKIKTPQSEKYWLDSLVPLSVRLWLDECLRPLYPGSDDYYWTIDTKTGLVDVTGSFNCAGQGLSDLKGVKFGLVLGYFNCSHNNLKQSTEGLIN